jgi:hypothetical protein
MDEKIENLNQSQITYHIRFQRLCGELNEFTNTMTRFLIGSTHLPPEFHADFKPLFLKYSELYTEFGECMQDIGDNGAAYFDWFREYTTLQQNKINILEQVVKTLELANEINDQIIVAQEATINALKT